MPPKPSTAASTGPPIQVLVVDNDRAPAEAMADSLRSVGFACTVAGGGREAASLLEATTFEIVVTDLKENTFFALIHLNISGERVAIDARPSDAIALALRASAPIFVEESVIEQSKLVEPSTPQAESERLHKWLESLDPDDLGKYKM